MEVFLRLKMETVRANPPFTPFKAFQLQAVLLAWRRSISEICWIEATDAVRKSIENSYGKVSQVGVLCV